MWNVTQSQVLGGGFSFQKCSVGGCWSWKVTASNITGGTQLLYVTDIQTPYGSLYNTTIPIPADVVQSMADSIVSFQSQLTPQIYLIDPSQSSISLTVVESGPTVESSDLLVQNIGSFGSFMTVSASSSVPWLSSAPTSIPGIGKNGTGSFIGRVNPSTLLSSASPYSGMLSLTDNAGHVVPIAFIVTVLPRPTIQLIPDTITLAYYIASTTGSSPITVTVKNNGLSGSILDFSLAKILNQSAWLAFSPTSGASIPSGSSVDITFSIVTASVPMIPGTYVETIAVTANTATNSPQTITVNLIVT